MGKTGLYWTSPVSPLEAMLLKAAVDADYEVPSVRQRRVLALRCEETNRFVSETCQHRPADFWGRDLLSRAWCTSDKTETGGRLWLDIWLLIAESTQITRSRAKTRLCPKGTGKAWGECVKREVRTPETEVCGNKMVMRRRVTAGGKTALMWWPEEGCPGSTEIGRTCHMSTWGKSIPGRGSSTCQGPVVDTLRGGSELE